MVKLKLLNDDSGAFTLKEMVEGVLTLGVGVILMGILLPIAFEIFGGLPIAIGGTEANPTMTGLLWSYIPLFVVLMLLIGIVYAILGWVGGVRGEKDE